MADPFRGRLSLWPSRRYRCTFRRMISVVIVIATLLFITITKYDKSRWAEAAPCFEKSSYKNLELGNTPDASEEFASQLRLTEEDSKFSNYCQSYDGLKASELWHGLNELLEALPDKSSYNDLLQPISCGGERHIRTFGLRVREFKRYLEAWEKFHVIRNEDIFSVRDDLIQHLWCSAPTLPAGKKAFSLNARLQAYGLFRTLLTNMSNFLFPWATQYSGDLASMHTQIHNGGRGIVLTAGDYQARYLLTSIRLIRKLGCDLPIEVMYWGDEDLSSDLRAEIEGQLPGVTTRDLKRMINDDSLELTFFAGKPFALLFSSFREVILVDADALFFQNPEELFSDPGYVDNGALFFHDRNIGLRGEGWRSKFLGLFRERDSAVWRNRRWLQKALPYPVSEKAKQSRFWTGQSGHMQESGVVVVDKWTHFVSLLLVTYLNGPGRYGKIEDGAAGFYNMFHGDKESFWIGWELAGDERYTFHNGAVAVVGSLLSIGPEPKASISANPAKSTLINTGKNRRIMSIYDKDVTVCAPQILHLGEDGAPLWLNGWILTNKYDTENQTLVDFHHYMPEPTIFKGAGLWSLKESNTACLTARQTIDFTTTEREILDDVVQIALEVGAYTPP